MTNPPVKIAKTVCGKIVKVYDQVSDWQTITDGAKYPELWATQYKHCGAIDALNRSLEINGLTLLEIIK
jgi:hypothetical protein